MNSNFPRVITLLRKEKGLSQKSVAQDLGVSQALLSHYEKGIRECGLNFLVQIANYYDVSCDYLLGRSNERSGALINYEDIPEPEQSGKENRLKGSVLPALNKKLIANSLNILFDKLQGVNNKTLTNEATKFLMLSVYRMIRMANSTSPGFEKGAFSVSDAQYTALSTAAMQICESNALQLMNGEYVQGDKLENSRDMNISLETLAKDYPLFSSSLLSLIKSSETTMLELIK
ncbi:MAG: helix-turn-helix transcriptional regulator [Clostridia bacterium]|nr:helix-turn-helix transcriptional regulator [Clostridia bacterium]